MIDTVVRIATPEGVAFDLHPAGLPARLAAYTLDLAIQAGVLIVLVIIAALLQVTGTWLTLLISFVVNWFYMVILEMSMNGRSIGKRALGLQVVMRDGSSIQLGASVVRNLLRFLDPILLMGLFLPLFDKTFRRLGDLVASTMVIYSPEKLVREAKIDNFADLNPKPSERIAEEETIQAIVAFAQRRKGLGPSRRRELAELALPLLTIQPERLVAAPYSQNHDPVESYVVSVAAWHAGVRASKPGKE